VPDDGAVVDQEQVGDGAEAFEGFVFVGADRFVAEVAAVATTGNPSAERSRWCSGVYGSITPRLGLPGAADVANG
jgi:hypothetical protein